MIITLPVVHRLLFFSRHICRFITNIKFLCFLTLSTSHTLLRGSLAVPWPGHYSLRPGLANLRPTFTVWHAERFPWQNPIEMWRHTVSHGRDVKGKLANGVGRQYSSHYLWTLCIQHYYRWCAHLGCQQPTELTLSADLIGLVLFTERRSLVSARVPSHFKRSLSGFHYCSLFYFIYPISLSISQKIFYIQGYS